MSVSIYFIMKTAMPYPATHRYGRQGLGLGLELGSGLGLSMPVSIHLVSKMPYPATRRYGRQGAVCRRVRKSLRYRTV